MAGARSLPEQIQPYVLLLQARLARQRWQHSCSPGTGPRPGVVQHPQRLPCPTAVDIQRSPGRSHARVLAELAPGGAQLPRATLEECVLVSSHVLLSAHYDATTLVGLRS